VGRGKRLAVGELWRCIDHLAQLAQRQAEHQPFSQRLLTEIKFSCSQAGCSHELLRGGLTARVTV